MTTVTHGNTGSGDDGIVRPPFAARWEAGSEFERDVEAKLRRCGYEVINVTVEQAPRSPGLIAALREHGLWDFGGGDLLAWKPGEGFTLVDCKTCCPRWQLSLPGMESWSISIKAVRKMQVWCLDRYKGVTGVYVLGDYTCMSWSKALGKGRDEGDYRIVNSVDGAPWEQYFGYDTDGGEWPGDWPLMPAA